MLRRKYSRINDNFLTLVAPIIFWALVLLLVKGCNAIIDKDLNPPIAPASEWLSITSESSIKSNANNPYHFQVHFIDVGQADAALVLCDGEAMLIDGGNSADSDLMYAYLEKYNINHLEYVIGTHAHEDHIGGLSGALNYATVDKVFCPTKSYSTSAFKNFLKSLDRQNVSITIPNVDDTFSLGSAKCTILAVNTDNEDINDTSIVLRVVYGTTSFLFTGDAESLVNKTLTENGEDISSTVLKVGHHGSLNSTSWILDEASPQYAVISVGKDNDYGHPDSHVLTILRRDAIKTLRTDKHGDIICISDGKSVQFSVERNINANVFSNLE